MSNLDYDKSELIESLTDRLGVELEKIVLSAESTRQASINAPSAMQSRYDTSRIEQGYLADTLNMRSVGLKKGLHSLGFLSLPENPITVGVGCVVRVKDDFGTDDYLILPYGGGETIETAQGEVIVVTPDAPLAQSMMGLKKRESGSYTVNRRSIEFTIVDFI